jgi:hypothetical protein
VVLSGVVLGQVDQAEGVTLEVDVERPDGDVTEDAPGQRVQSSVVPAAFPMAAVTEPKNCPPSYVPIEPVR